MVKKILQYSFFFCFFLVLTLFVSLRIQYNNWKYILKSLGAFTRQCIINKPIKNVNFPNRLELLCNHLKILLNTGSKKDKNLIKKINLGNFNISFFNWDDLHVVYNEIFIHKEYFFQTKKEDPFIIDCGSNIGISVLFFKTLYPKAEVIAFEPSNLNFKILEHNIKNNNIKNVILKKYALYNKRCKVVLDRPDSIVSKISEQTSFTHNEYVETALLSDYINKEVDLLKIDIEGAEGIVLEELHKKNKLKFIKKMILEYHYSVNNKLSKLIKILEKNNFNYQIRNTLKTPFINGIMPPFLIYAYNKKQY